MAADTLPSSSSNSGISSELKVDAPPMVSFVVAGFSSVNTSGVSPVSSGSVSSGASEVNSSANIICGMLVEHSARAMIPASNFFFIIDRLLS